MEKNQIFENIMNRTSVRSYTDMPPLAIVVCGCLDKTLEGTEQEFWIQDCSAATENILLMAHGLGLGCVWTALYPLKERYEGMQQLLHLPKTMIPLNTLIIGYPKNQVAAKDKWKEENISYTSNPQPIGFSGILLAKRQNSFYCTYFLHNRNVADTKSPYPIKRLEVIRWFNQKSMVFNQSLS